MTDEQLTIIQALALAAAHEDAGRVAEADALYWRILQSDAKCADAWNRIGVLAHTAGRNDVAYVFIRRAIELHPTFGHFHNALGKVLLAMGRTEEALGALEWSRDLDPSCYSLWNNLGTAYKTLDRLTEAEAAFLRVLTLKPDSAIAYANLCSVYMTIGETAKAVEVGRKAVALAPDWPDAHWNLSLALLKSGEWDAGWREFEWRWRVPSFSTAYLQTDVPQWRGEDLTGKAILVWAEQGAGDTIMLARYLRVLGDGVYLKCDDSLRRLFQGHARHPDHVDAAGFDYHVPMMSLPALLGRPGPWSPALDWRGYGYITQEQPRRVHFGFTLHPHGLPATDDTLRVGVCWAGNPAHANDRNRSLAASALEPLRTDGVAFYSLQKGPAAAETPLWMTDLMGECHDYADTAALIANLDLVIAVDTSVAHLAGAMGKPVWLILPEHGVDWRWGDAGETTPWYPTMRVFRAGGVAAVARALRERVADRQPVLA